MEILNKFVKMEHLMKVPHTKKGIRRLLGIKKVADIPKKLSPREKAVAALRVMKLFQVSAWDYFKELWEEKVKEGTIQEWTTRNGTTPSVKTGKANLRDLHIRIADYLGFDSRKLVTKAPPLSGTSSANTSNASTSSAKTSSGSLSETSNTGDDSHKAPPPSGTSTANTGNASTSSGSGPVLLDDSQAASGNYPSGNGGNTQAEQSEEETKKQIADLQA